MERRKSNTENGDVEANINSQEVARVGKSNRTNRVGRWHLSSCIGSPLVWQDFHLCDPRGLEEAQVNLSCPFPLDHG